MIFTTTPPSTWIWSPIAQVNSDWVGMVISHMACLVGLPFDYR